MDKEDKRGIFFGVIGVLTLIVAIIGASLAYFSINARSDDDALKVQAASVLIVYEGGNKLDVNNIIPSEKNIALRTYNRFLKKETHTVTLPDGGTRNETYKKCTDDKGFIVCGAYNFTLTNNGPNSNQITMKIVPTVGDTDKPKFKNLKYVLYDISDDSISYDDALGDYNGTGTPVKEGSFTYYEDPETGKITYNEFYIISETDSSEEFTIAGKADGAEKGEVRRYRLFIWLDELSDGTTEVAQDYEQGAVFQGAVQIEVVGSEKLTGTAAGA